MESSIERIKREKKAKKAALNTTTRRVVTEKKDRDTRGRKTKFKIGSIVVQTSVAIEENMLEKIKTIAKINGFTHYSDYVRSLLNQEIEAFDAGSTVAATSDLDLDFDI